VFTEAPTKDYFRSLIYLENKGKAKLEFIDSRIIYLIGLRLYYTFGFLRWFGNKFFDKPLDVKRVCLMGVLKSFSYYFRMLFTDRIIVALFAPYSWISIYLFLLKKLGRKVVYMSSWPVWDGSYYVHKPNFIKLYFWNKFLVNIPIVTVSETAKNNLSKYSNNILQIPHSVDINLFKTGVKNKKFTVLYVGRMIKEKGIRDLLEVAKELVDIEFIFIGKGKIEDEVKNCGFNNVKYLGFIDHKDLPKLYASSHVFILNSFKTSKWEELYGIVLLEALSCGTTVISTDCVGPKEIVSKDVGILITQRNKDVLKKAIVYAFKNKVKINLMGKRGRKLVEGKYNVEDLSKKWDEFLSSNF